MTLITTASAPGGRGPPGELDVAKALVMAGLAHLVTKGGAMTVTLESGALELRLATGEICYLGQGTITRIA